MDSDPARIPRMQAASNKSPSKDAMTKDAMTKAAHVDGAASTPMSPTPQGKRSSRDMAHIPKPQGVGLVYAARMAFRDADTDQSNALRREVPSCMYSSKLMHHFGLTALCRSW